MMIVASHDKIMWAPFKFEENKDANKDGEDSTNRSQVEDTIIKQGGSALDVS